MNRVYLFFLYTSCDGSRARDTPSNSFVFSFFKSAVAPAAAPEMYNLLIINKRSAGIHPDTVYLPADADPHPPKNCAPISNI